MQILGNPGGVHPAGTNQNMKPDSTQNAGEVLVVEPSATLRHALRRQLVRRGFVAHTTTSYRTGLEHLRRSGTAAVVVGLPTQTCDASDALLQALTDSARADQPLVLLAPVPRSEIFAWVARRPRTALLLWDDYTECGDCLARLLAPPARSAPPTLAIEHGIRVLFVDDSRTVRASFSRLLARHGYHVETATNADEAFALACVRPFDVAIVDYFMPGGNGDMLCRRLREDARTEGITTAILTGTYHEDIIRGSLDAGAIECMFKNEADELFLARIGAMSRAIRAKQSIETERRRLAGILGSVGDGVYGVDNTGEITFINPAARSILGYDEHEAIGRSAHELFHYALEDGTPNPVENCFLQHAYAGGGELSARASVFWHRQRRAVPVECTVFPLRIEGRLEGSVIAFRDISERRLLEKELLWQANHDSLTKLYNRNHFERALDAEVTRLKRSREHSALLYIDLDRFKYINDTAGHAAGDQLLCEIASQLQARLRESDLLARLGGDEFAVILRNIDKPRVPEVADGFREVLEQLSFVYGDRQHKVNGSIGVALVDRNAQSPGEVLANADIACHIAKSRGRNQTHLYCPESDAKVAIHLELGWSARLQDALKHDLFALHYQPIVPVGGVHQPAERQIASCSNVPMHYEVLVRFMDKRGELIGPNAFLPTAERFGLMPQIDAWVLTHAMQKLAELQASGVTPTFTINISGQTLDADHLVPLLKRLLQQHRLDPTTLILEITETSAIANLDGAKRLIAEMRSLGCRFALDDFGSGFSSFNHLKHLPVDFIKIDGQFVQGMVNDPIDRAIVASINDIAHSFGKRTVAEFVETPAILRLLKEYGVDYAQGHYIASPGAELITEFTRGKDVAG